MDEPQLMDVSVIGDESGLEHAVLDYCVWSPALDHHVMVRCVFTGLDGRLRLVVGSGDPSVDNWVLGSVECMNEAKEAMAAHRDDIKDRLRSMN